MTESPEEIARKLVHSRMNEWVDWEPHWPDEPGGKVLLYVDEAIADISAAIQKATTEQERVLAAALLWLRNHYECDVRSDLEFRMAVQKRIDDVLEKYDVDGKDLELFRLAYPTPNYWKPKHETVRGNRNGV